ncbi:MAG: SPOR domain-containing protein [Erythrobacter sp.]|nr:MAG: SPOR domain-containing protein [Erythrobacter sp.]
MSQMKSGWLVGAALFATVTFAAPLSATVRDGVEAWSRGDYTTAVAEWRGPAEAGDPDAMFNLGQAYRLGRGVPQDVARAEELYARAAQAGHVQAADTFGLMLFQDGRREAALPYVQDAARRGDPRAQYLLGIAHFNGDLVAQDWERAYALLTLANGAGLPQAGPALAQMDEHIPIEQRQNAAGLARQLEAEAVQARAVELAAADLSAQDGPPVRAAAQASGAPRPNPSVAVSPSVAAARDAVRQATEATGTASPADAGATFARAEAPSAVPTPTPAPLRQVAATAAPAAARINGPWRLQLGAFGVAGNAERLWTQLSSRPEVAGRERLLVPSGRVTRLLAGGYASRNEAQSACNSLRRAGHDCIVSRD